MFTYSPIAADISNVRALLSMQSCLPCQNQTKQDVGGQEKIRHIWRHYYTDTQGLIFVVDCEDRSRIDEARQELHKIIDDPEMKSVIILVLANKQDRPDGKFAVDL